MMSSTPRAKSSRKMSPPLSPMVPISEIEIEAFRQRTNRRNIFWDDLDAGDGKAGSIRRTRKAMNDKERNEHRMLVKKNHAPAVRFATLAHELGHLFLGHLGLDKALHVPDRHDQADSLSRGMFTLGTSIIIKIVCKITTNVCKLSFALPKI